MYGDIPYFEAGEGYLEDIYKFKYDRQSEINPDMLKELEEAALQLAPSKIFFGSANYLYNGNVDQWQRFAYSLMLRLGMRLTEVDFRKSCGKNRVNANVCFNKRNGEDDRDEYFDQKLYEHCYGVELTNAWMDSYRSLLNRFDTTNESWEGFIYLASS